jgi:DNA adenine methylase
MKTPVTYWGGKQQLTPKILSLIPPHERYNEPFFGGGAIFFAKQPAEIEFINDINGEMVNFYRTLKLKFDELKIEIDCTLHSEFQHNQALEIYANPLNNNDVLRAWAVWMLSHQSFNACLTGSWSVFIAKNKAKQIQWHKDVFTIAYVRRLERTSIFCRDAISVIKSTDTPTTFHYVDPPYYNADMGHYGGYTEQNFENLLIVLTKIEGKFMLSSYQSELLNKYTKQAGWYTINIEMIKASGHGSGSTKTEVITVNYDSDNISQQARLF